MATLMQANRQWSTRPDDERFTNLIELRDHVKSQHDNARVFDIQSRKLSFLPASNDIESGLLLTAGGGNGVAPTNWSFGQLARLARVKGVAPSPNYLATLPAPMAADCLNYGLQFGDVQEQRLMINLNPETGKPEEMRAATSTGYGRIWNKDIVNSLVDLFGDGISGAWRVPGEFGKAVEVTKANTTLYASDRDFFVFLADEERRIEMPNRRGGKSGSLARGFFCWNSEVGAATFGIAAFLFDYVCCNRIVWGAEGFKEFKLKHTSRAPTRWLDEVKPVIDAYADESARSIESAIVAAQNKRVDDVETFLKNRFTGKATRAIMDAHMSAEQRPMESLWDITTGVTEYAKSIPFTNERVDVERIGGNILAMAA